MTPEFKNGPEKLYIGLDENKYSLKKYLMPLGFWINKLSEHTSLHMYFVCFPMSRDIK